MTTILDLLAAGAAASWAVSTVILLAPVLRPGCSAALPSCLKRSRRRERALELGLADALDALGAGLAAGQSLQQAMAVVSEDERQPLTPLFRSVLNGVAAGRRMEDALAEAAQGFTLPSVPLALLSMASACRSGGNLAQSLRFMARLCRDRVAVRRQVEAKTAQARAQGTVLILVPILFLAGLLLVSPASLRAVAGSPVGRSMLLGAAALQACGWLAIRAMVRKEFL